MSTPTTPARSIASSTLSTPPTARNGNSPQELTPRSKVKAMLAAIDDDTDTELPADIHGQPRTPLGPVSGNIGKTDDREDLKLEKALSSQEREESDEEDEEDGESLFVPRGGVAARLKSQAKATEDSDSNSERISDKNAYARIKRELMSHKEREAIRASVRDRESSSDQAERRRIRSISRQNTPEMLSNQMKSPTVSAARSQRSSSPGLFVTPEGAPRSSKLLSQPPIEDALDSDLPADPNSKSLLMELVARKQAELKAKQAVEDQKRKDKVAKQRSFEKDLSRDASTALSDEDGLTDQRLTQQSRPTRKASKKALEEMNRETQRMSRNMQLAHQAKTKKKITKDSLFARFNFRTPGNLVGQVSQNPSSSTAASSAQTSDMEGLLAKDSPPTSPIESETPFMAPSGQGIDRDLVVAGMETVGYEDELPSMQEIMTQPLDKGKRKAIDKITTQEPHDPRRRKTIFTQPPIKVRPPRPSKASKDANLDSDSDLEVLPTRKSRTSKCDVFDRLPASKVQEGRSMQTLRALAHLASPDRQMHGKKPGMSLADMQTSLQRRARQQAVEERAVKIEQLKSRGIILQTAEERQQDQAEVEDLLEKARREGEDIMQKEKRAAKKAKIANGEADDLPDSSDEDEEYHDDQADGPDVELSGSDEDGEEMDQSASDAESTSGDDAEGGVPLGKENFGRSGLVDDEASEDGDDEQDENIRTDDEDEEDENVPQNQHHRSRRNKMVIDDEDDENVELGPLQATQDDSPGVQVPIFPAGPLNFGAVPMGMTQAFAATMADTQSQRYGNDEEQDSMALLDSVPEPNFPMYDANDSIQLVEDSQDDLQQPEMNTSKEIDLHFSQSQIRFDAPGETQGQEDTATQLSEIPDPTQDVGFGLSSPAPQRFVSEPPSTVDTVLLPDAAGADSPVKKRGRLRRRAVMEQSSFSVDEDPATTVHESPGVNAATGAFDAMRKAGKAAKAAAAKEAFDKKKSEAKRMVEEQAQESEDEYAGLGGASDEDSGEEDEDVEAMMDHGEVKVDERRLAQFYANKERASDEKAVEKLYKDINSGMLRRKRGADFDLSDSDEDAEARRRRKQREFAKLRKALLTDENVGKIAEDPKKSAFLHTMEDREHDDDLDFLDRPAEESFRVDPSTQEEPDSQTQPQSQQPTLPAPSVSKRKRPLQDSIPDNTRDMRPPASARRTAAPKKPATLAEIRESVSFLIEDPGSINNITAEPSSSADEDEENRTTDPNPRRTPANPIIDRLSLKRAESTSASTSSRLAFHDPAMNPSIGGFKVPSLLRRATTSQLNANGADANGISTNATAAAATERAAGGGEKGDFVRRGGGKRSSINFVGRDRERRGVVEGVERRRREERERVARERRRSGLGGLGVGSFE